IADIFHSIAGLEGFEGAASGVPGRDLFSRRIEPAPCYSKLFIGRADVGSRTGVPARSVVSPDIRQYILNADKSWECYDLKTDLAEQDNLVPSRVSRAAVEETIAEYEKALIVLDETRADLAISEQFTVDPQRAGALRALGYAGGSSATGGPVHPHAAEHLNIGIFRSLRGEYEESEKELRMAFSMDPENRQVRRNLGFTLFRLGKLDEAVRVLRSLAAAGEDDLLVRLVLGQALEKAGRSAEALEQYLAASDRHPEDSDAALSAGRLLAAAGREAEAVRIIDRLLSSQPDDPKLLAGAIALFFSAGRWQPAHEYLSRALKRERTAASLQNITIVCLKLDRKDEARGYLNELLGMEISPDLRRRVQMQLDALAK
ncbi:MAG TPA: tetratricopeptide repeat protein, partial [Candidatus Glassbacteria bacterium]|nr:tetratricopeptide repeat protein [Candidatus Glassbacteria bacterium]